MASGLSGFLLKIRKAETPFYARLKKLILALAITEVPMPGFTRPLWSLLYHLRMMVPEVWRRLLSVAYRIPLFKSQCAQVGRRLYLEQIPHISGKVKLILGDDVNISGHFSVRAGRTFEDPEIILGNKVFVGHQVTMQVAKRIEIEEGAALAAGCYVTDNDGHPLDIAARLRKEPVAPEEVMPVRIGRHAWIGRGSSIMKGVTIGEFAIVGVNSVVISDVPAYSIAMGNPARVVKKMPPPDPPPGPVLG
ncbi:MAG: acyltransferase [Acidobacteria bacterium]|nr:acyltransferase [Acidobacteriota bacterium]